LPSENSSHENASYAKKNFYRDSDGKLNWKLRQSEDIFNFQFNLPSESR